MPFASVITPAVIGFSLLQVSAELNDATLQHLFFYRSTPTDKLSGISIYSESPGPSLLSPLYHVNSSKLDKSSLITLELDRSLYSYWRLVSTSVIKNYSTSIFNTQLKFSFNTNNKNSFTLT